MISLTLREIAQATNGKIISGEENLEISSVSIDTRKILPKGLFVALKGEKVDAHDYVDVAFRGGAVAVIVEKKIKTDSQNGVILVDDTKEALGKLSKYYKGLFNLKTIAITGSVGKTTTKDMIFSVMNMQYNTIKTEGNFNNEIGLPLTVLRLSNGHEAAVLEMGMSAFGEISYLSDIARPDVAVITNIGMSHIENLGSQEGIYEAKTEVCQFMNKDGLLVVNGDDKFLINAKKKKGIKVVTYGIENSECDYLAYDIENLGIEGTVFKTKLYEVEYKIHIKTPGVHNVYNALAACICGMHYNIAPKRIVEGIENFSLTKMRMAIEKIGDMVVINDCYNSSPDSVVAALKVLSSQNTKKVAILGDILEMGEFSEPQHYQLGSEVIKNNIDFLITVGENAKHIASGAKDAGMREDSIVSFDTTKEAKENILKYINENDSILIKASRGMSFEEITEEIIEKFKDEAI